MKNCWKSGEMKLPLLSKSWKSQRGMQVTPVAGAPNATKYLQVFGSRWAHITRRRALDHLCQLSIFTGDVVPGSVLMCSFITPFITILTCNQHMGCTVMKFCPVSPHLQSGAHSKVHRKAFSVCSHRAGPVPGSEKGRASHHCTPCSARHIHFHRNSSCYSHHWAGRLESDRQRNTMRMVNEA